MEKKKYILLFATVFYSFIAFSQAVFTPATIAENEVNELLKVPSSNSVNQATLVLLKDTIGFSITEKNQYNEDIEKNFQVMLFPNPSQDVVTIRANEQMLDDNTRVMQLYNEKGELLDQTENFNSLTTFNIEGYPVGNYYLRVNLKHEQIYCKVKKLINSTIQYTTLAGWNRLN